MSTAQTAPIALSPAQSRLALPILAGGIIAGTFDLISALMTFGPNGMRGVAAGLLGRSAFQGGTAAFVTGVLLHYLIALAIAATYCLASRRLPFLRSHFLTCGLFYGLGVWAVMTLVVLPLCALHLSGPYSWRGAATGIGFHMVLIGLPVSLSLRALGAGAPAR